jgi:hypothetical protein
VYGTIAGTITDPTGAALAGTNVTLINLDSNEKHAIATGASGDYTFVDILPGRYKIEAEKNGFKKFVREPIIVEIESGLKVDIALQVGAQTETVEVSAASAPAGNELAGASCRRKCSRGAAPERPQSPRLSGISARRGPAGPALSWERLRWHPGRR